MSQNFNINSASIEDLNAISASIDSLKISGADVKEFLKLSGSLSLSGSFSINDNFIENILGENFRKDIKVITGSMTYKIPSWANEVMIISIGPGGGGGGGLSTDDLDFVTGGAGGSGGNISYRLFKQPGLYPDKSWIVSCLIPPVANGGEGKYQSEINAINVNEIYNDFESKWITNVNTKLFNSFYGLGFNYAKNAFQKRNVLSMYTGSKGKDGGITSAWFIESSSMGYVLNDLDESRLVAAVGGRGGFGAVGIKSNDKTSDTWIENEYVRNNTIPFSEPGTNAIYPNFDWGDEIFVGSPGGYGISEPIATTIESRGYVLDKYLNSSVNSPQNYLSPTSPSSIFINSVIEGRNGDDKNTYIFGYTSKIGSIGGAGGNGWISGSWNANNYSQIDIGKSGKHYLGKNENNKIDFYEFSTGGDGGNITTRNGLPNTLPTSGSGFGAGGGGGASDGTGQPPQSGSNGNKGAVIIISTGFSSYKQQNNQ